jgi:2-polyprenyl-6-methoxyphenol hydroxylase-like FAD-dependent oxidoreductase
MTDTTARSALVIGGGIAGPVTALALRRAGINATVYEAYSGGDEGIGGMLGIASNGISALDVVGAGDAVRGIGIPVKSMILQSWTGKRLAEFGTLPGLDPTQTVWRHELSKVLREAAQAQGIRYETGKRLVTAEEQADGVTAVFEDGTTARADILVGADGIRSVVRGLIDPSAPGPRYTGLVGIGGRPRGRISGVPLGDTGIMFMIFGKQAFFAYQVYQDGSVGWFANLPRTEPIWHAEAQAIGAEEWLRRLRKTFAEDRTPAPAILQHARPEDLVIVGGLQDMPTVPHWSRGRMVLVGDSAHATSPSSGQGVSVAAESAVELARCLRDLPIRQAFSRYEAIRRPRVERIIASAARTNSHKAAGPVGRVIRDTIFPVVIKFAKPDRFAWQFAHRIDWDAKVH